MRDGTNLTVESVNLPPSLEGNLLFLGEIDRHDGRKRRGDSAGSRIRSRKRVTM